MSLTSAMQSGVAGLLANSTALSTISNNIANVNTVGYKQSDTNFESLVTSNNGNVSDTAGGVAAATQQLVSQQGQFTQTDSPTDLAISGQGFFVTSTSAASISSTNAALFTRAGSFLPNSAGFLENSAGLVLQGWPADSSGNISTSSSSLSSLQPINVTDLGGAVKPTTTVSITANLNSTQTVSAAATAAGATPAGAGAYNPATNSMAMNGVNSSTGVAPDYTIQIPTSDSQGDQHTLQLDLLRSSTPNQWYAELVAVPASDVTDGSGLSDGQIATGMIGFTSTGQLDPATTTIFSATNPSITLGASNAGAPAAGAVNWSSSLGVAAQTISLNLTGSTSGTGGITQLDSANSQSITTNGTAFGSLASVAISASGLVTAVYSNGVSQNLAQVALATFPNPDGLSAVNGNAFQISQNSGAITLDTPGQGGAGALDPNNLEGSTVDLSSQLTDLITSQSAYSASSKIITTADQMMQDLLQIIQ
jgi:flagellar hook protein FlgE